MGRMSLTKGKQGEREAAAELRRLFGVEAFRGRQYSGSPDSPDVRTSLAGVHFEIKRCERLRLYDALGQAIEDAGEALPVVLHRANNRPWVWIAKLDDMPELTTKLYLAMASR